MIGCGQGPTGGAHHGCVVKSFYLYQQMFQRHVQSPQQNAKLDDLHILGTVPLDASSMEQIKAILDKAVDTYDKLCTAQIWNSTSKGGPCAATFVTVDKKCWNCNGSDHQAQTCPKAQNKSLLRRIARLFKRQRNRGTKMA